MTIPVVEAGGGGGTFLDGMRLAAARIDLALDVREEGDPEVLLRQAIAERPPAILVIGPAALVVEARPDIEQARVPVIVLGGDLYTARALFRYAFQTSVPLRWQARVLAHYLVGDRGYGRIAVQGEEATAEPALAEEGASPVQPAEDVDAVMFLGGRVVPPAPPEAQLALSAEALRRSGTLPAGTVTCYPYTWAGWAEPIRRVARFRAGFAAELGHLPTGFEQEGYDAVRALAEALSQTGGEGGDPLVRALESFREETYSALPIRLGPDDHVLAEESHLGLFAVAAPDEPAPGEAVGSVPWRPLMRTFTTNGERVNLIERDVRVFFPSWRPPAPRPNYWRSRYGIVTRSDDDPLH